MATYVKAACDIPTYEMYDVDTFLGYIRRVDYILGVSQERPSYWVATLDLKNPKWFGCFRTRREARIGLWAIKSYNREGN
jgi:hypothetical protein